LLRLLIDDLAQRRNAPGAGASFLGGRIIRFTRLPTLGVFSARSLDRDFIRRQLICGFLVGFFRDLADEDQSF